MQGGPHIKINVATGAAYPNGTHTYSTVLPPTVPCTSLAASTSLTVGGNIALTTASLANYVSPTDIGPVPVSVFM